MRQMILHPPGQSATLSAVLDSPRSLPGATYYPWFDWLRAVCACTVMWGHGGIISWEHAGNFAVQVFFALSGWLIGAMLIKLAPPDLTRFYFNRALRIWVPYYIAAALLLSLSIVREPITAKWLEIVGYKLTFVYNLFGVAQLDQFRDCMPQKGTLSHFWSVNAEEQFYLIAPLFLVLLPPKLGRSVLLWSALTLGSLYTGYASIILGVLSALLVGRYGPAHLKRGVRLVVAAALVPCFFEFAAGRNYQELAPFAALCIVLLLARPGERNAAGSIFGGMSYPLYLNHWFGLFATALVLKHLPFVVGSGTTALLQAAFNLPLAIALYWWVDRRLMANRSSWFTPSRARALTVTAYGMVAVGVAFGLTMQAIDK